MSGKSEEFFLRRARLLTLVVLTVVAVAITLANLSSEAVTASLIDRSPSERAYGWPLSWYWRSSIPVLGKGLPFLQWPVSRLSTSSLTANLAMWLALMTATLLAGKWLLRGYLPRRYWRPHVSTLVVLLFVAAPTFLANLSFDISPRSSNASFGWPLVWYWHVVVSSKVLGLAHGWDYSALWLAGNLVIWLAMLAVAALAWHWLLRRYRPRFQWKVRTMLIGVGLTGVLCAWCVSARNRAHEQDPLIAWADRVYVERWGPKWLDVVGADRFRRRIVGAFVQADRDEELFRRLARLPDIRYLDIRLGVTRPGIAAALGDMRQLRMLRIQIWDEPERAIECLAAVGKLTQLERLELVVARADDLRYFAGLTNLKSLTLRIDDEDEEDAQECLAAVGKLTQLERLDLSNSFRIRSEGLAYLRGLTKLKSLKLPTVDRPDEEENEETVEHETDIESPSLVHLPVLPELEALDLHTMRIGRQDLRRLTDFPRLKSLNLSGSGGSLAELAALRSLEELSISATLEGIESLVALKQLRVVHVGGGAGWYPGRLELAHNGSFELTVSPNGDDRWRRALSELRQSNPGIVIDAYHRDFQEKGDLDPPWDREYWVDRSDLGKYLWQLAYMAGP